MNPSRILIVEDSRTQAEHLRLLLDESGYHTEVALDGKKAWEKIDLFQPHLVISDVVMPEMTGYELCERIRQHIKFKSIPIVLLTTLSGTEDVIHGLECGASNFIIKPYEDEYLLRRVNRILLDKTEFHAQNAPPITFSIGEKSYTITAERTRILNLLISIYDTSLQKNQQLSEMQLQLQSLNQDLEIKVEERTAELRSEMEDRKRYEEQFLQAQKMEGLGQIAGGIAHDFNNILMVIRGNLELLSMQFAENTKEGKRIRAAVEASDRGVALIKRLMGFSRKQELQPQPVNINETIESFSKLLKSVLTEAITTDISIAKEAWVVYTDPNQLEIALLNLAVNARDAMKGRGKLKIDVSNVTVNETLKEGKFKINPGDYVKISMTDSGEGIPSEIMDRIFEPFFTTKEPGKGTGLGLSMVYGFIKQSSGHVTVLSVTGQGTTVSLYLPRSNEVLTKQPIQKQSQLQKHTANEKILVVEDEESLRELTSEFLKGQGYQVITAEDGVQALAILKKDKTIDLLFSDVVMPNGLSGIELAQKAKQLYPKLKIILTSGYPGKALETTSTTPEIPYQIIQKPYRMNELAQVIRQVLGTTIM